MRLDPAQGSTVKRDVAFEAANRRSAEALARDDWGRQSLSGHERNRLFLSDRGRQFSDLSLLSGADHRGDGRAFALLDYNRDGWVDLAVANTNKPSLVLFKNELHLPRRVLALQLTGGPRSNRDAIGAQVRLRVGDRLQLRELHAGEGNAAQNSKTLVFGLGVAEAAEAVSIRWPSGHLQELGRLPAGHVVRVSEGEAPALEPYTP
ncbi:MAG: CRTAC1 family protein [Verrucomicrobiales bacterium]